MSQARIQSLSVRQAEELLAAGGLDLVDVREPSEWALGHLPGARLVPLDTLRAAPESALPRDGIVFVCAAGVRSQTAARIAAGLGYQRLYNLTSGTRGWAAAGLPIVIDAALESNAA